jgi:DNA-binding NarL/FixJ family response regulator
MTPIRVLLADDHARFRQGIATLLAAQQDFEVVGEASNGHEAVQMARALAPDVVLMDVSMPVLDGLTATRRIRAEMPHVGVVVLTIACDRQTRAEAERSGACACLSKNCDLLALRCALMGAVRSARSRTH